MAAAARDGGVALRRHAKTHKMVEVAALQPGAGAAGLTVAKLGEAEVFAAGGCEDILIAYPLIGDDIAAFVLATVVSRPAPDRAVVDAGTKVLSSNRLDAPGAPVGFGALTNGW